MVKIARLVTVDLEAYQLARDKGLNISEACEAGIRSALNMGEKRDEIEKNKPKYSAKMQELLDVITPEHLEKCTAAIEQGTEFSKGWQRILEDNYGIKVSRAEIIKVFGEHENQN